MRIGGGEERQRSGGGEQLGIDEHVHIGGYRRIGEHCWIDDDGNRIDGEYGRSGGEYSRIDSDPSYLVIIGDGLQDTG
jgi:hypothetical protein